jgi:hypothetical protein
VHHCDTGTARSTGWSSPGPDRFAVAGSGDLRPSETAEQAGGVVSHAPHLFRCSDLADVASAIWPKRTHSAWRCVDELAWVAATRISRRGGGRRHPGGRRGGHRVGMAPPIAPSGRCALVRAHVCGAGRPANLGSFYA